MNGSNLFRQRMFIGLTGLMSLILPITPAQAFCVRNDTGAPIMIEATEDSAVFSLELDNNKKACCQPKDEACAIGNDKVKLSISSSDSAASCSITVSPKGNVNVTGKPDRMKCKANKPGSTMDWASG